jgi:demethylmenaquinone methyltransferase/2-methoxy-6-polyprenyl-1,4-benzoquinol methylase
MTQSTQGTLPPREVERMFDRIAGPYDAMNHVMTAGLDRRWRQMAAAATELGNGATALDACCGTGDLTLALARQVGRTGRVTGLDFSGEMLKRARRKHPDEQSSQIEWVQGDATGMPFASDSFAAATIGFGLRNLPDPEAGLRELARVVRPGGRIAMLEFYVPPRPLLQPAWWLYTRVGLPALGRLVSREWYEVGRFLGPSIDGFWRRYPLPQVVEMWRGAGIDAVEARKMSLGGGVVMWGVRENGRA